MDQMALKKEIVERLQKVIDPETGVDVIRMQLVCDMKVDENGLVDYVFRPSSPLCPIAVPLALQIIQAIGETPGVSNQRITVKEYIEADKLNQLLRTCLEEL